MTQLDPPAFSESPGDDDYGDVRESNWRIDLDPRVRISCTYAYVRLNPPKIEDNEK